MIVGIYRIINFNRKTDDEVKLVVKTVEMAVAWEFLIDHPFNPEQVLLILMVVRLKISNRVQEDRCTLTIGI